MKITQLSTNFDYDDITTVILVKESSVDKEKALEHYVDAYDVLKAETTVVLPLMYNKNKIPAKLGKAYLDILQKELTHFPNLKNLVVADSNYFKFITKVVKVTNTYGVPYQGKYSGYEDYQCVYVSSYFSLFYTPANVNIIREGISALVKVKTADFIHSAVYCNNADTTVEFLDTLYQYPVLTMDIETTGLPLDSAIVTAGFAWDKHNGGVIDTYTVGTYHLARFLEQYKGKLIFHGGLFDLKLLITNLWMEDPQDYVGMQKGLNIFNNVDDTMLLTYLATNSTTDVPLSLKFNAMEYTGNYAVEVEKALLVPRAELMEYNLIDCLATWFVYEERLPQVITDDQYAIYQTIFKPSIKPLLKMMIVGLPIDLARVDVVEKEITKIRDTHLANLMSNPVIVKFNSRLQILATELKNAKLKTKVVTVQDFAHVVLNPNSPKQLALLFFDELGYESIMKTETGDPATGAKVLKRLKHQMTEPNHIAAIEDIIEFGKADKVVGTFIKAFKQVNDGFLHGNLKLGGTQSGRLSSNSPNLQNLPSGSTYGKLVKSCFIAKKDWLFAGADLSSLEDRINALLSKDPNKIKVYTDGYDGHCLRAHAYFGDQMTGIDANSVASINSIEVEYEALRQKSKVPTFALTYDGTWHTLHKNLGLPVEEAKSIEANYHELYKVSDEFSRKNVEFANNHGYMECAFGLRIRTPILAKCVAGSTKTPKAAEDESRSANNAVTQSWGMLVNRALAATNARIENSPHAFDILPVNTIHDAGYFMVRNTPEAVKFLNDTLIEEMEWNDHPLIKSTDVPMKASLEIGPSWDKIKKIPNRITLEELKEHELFK